MSCAGLTLLSSRGWLRLWRRELEEETDQVCALAGGVDLASLTEPATWSRDKLITREEKGRGKDLIWKDSALSS